MAEDQHSVVQTVEVDGRDCPIYKSKPLKHGWNGIDGSPDLHPTCLIDLGHAQLTDAPPTTDQLMPIALRAPEVVLKAGFGTPVDVWALGCLVSIIYSELGLLNRTLR